MHAIHNSHLQPRVTKETQTAEQQMTCLKIWHLKKKTFTPHFGIFHHACLNIHKVFIFCTAVCVCKCCMNVKVGGEETEGERCVEKGEIIGGSEGGSEGGADDGSVDGFYF